MASDTFEIAFSFDTTGSMYSCLEEVRNKLAAMVRSLKKDIPGIRIAIFAHGDYCDARSTYVTKYTNFTNDANSLCTFVNGVGATFGGDEPECYELVMREVQEKLSWSTGSQKSLVLIGDAPPHEPSESQNYRHLDWRKEIVRLRDMGIKIYAVECHGCSTDFYHRIGSQTFGERMSLSNINEVEKTLMNICYREAGLEHLATGSSPAYTPARAPAPSVVAPASPDITPTPVASEWEDMSEDSEDENSAGLKCYTCRKVKLANEFPPVTVTAECDHHPGVCLRCVVAYVREHKMCPQTGCGLPVDPDSRNMNWFQAILDRMFIDYSTVVMAQKMRGHHGDMLTVSTMNGDTAWVDFRPNMTVSQLKEEVERELGIKSNQQKLLYNEQVLKMNKSPGAPMRLVDYDIQKNADISVIVPLYCVPESLDHVVFDLSWEFPKVNPDFLDASCLTFNKTEFVQLIDWTHSKNDYYLKGSVVHSAKNEATSGGRVGHQTIHVYLKKVPGTISHLYFTLSSWRAPNLSGFSNPRLQFYEASDSSTDLCSTTFGHALSSQAVVLCSMVRAPGGQWQIFECDAGGCVNGNAKMYNPIRKRIVELIDAELKAM